MEGTLRSLFPILDGYRITHGWGGFMGVPRHRRPSVNFDQSTGLGWAGGYTGEGVAASNLAGRIMADNRADHEEFQTGKPAGFWGRMFNTFVG